MSEPSLYHHDVVAWADQQAEHVLKSFVDHNSLSKIVWASETETFLEQARDKFRNSMRQSVEMEKAWSRAFRAATRNLTVYRVSIPPGIPAKCPYTLDELLDETFTFDAALRRLHAVVEKWPRDGDQT